MHRRVAGLGKQAAQRQPLIPLQPPSLRSLLYHQSLSRLRGLRHICRVGSARSLERRLICSGLVCSLTPRAGGELSEVSTDLQQQLRTWWKKSAIMSAVTVLASEDTPSVTPMKIEWKMIPTCTRRPGQAAEPEGFTACLLLCPWSPEAGQL